VPMNVGILQLVADQYGANVSLFDPRLDMLPATARGILTGILCYSLLGRDSPPRKGRER